jgi:hypothetical protein
MRKTSLKWPQGSREELPTDSGQCSPQKVIHIAYASTPVLTADFDYGNS